MVSSALLSFLMLVPECYAKIKVKSVRIRAEENWAHAPTVPSDHNSRYASARLQRSGPGAGGWVRGLDHLQMGKHELQISEGLAN